VVIGQVADCAACPHDSPFTPALSHRTDTSAVVTRTATMWH